MKEFLMLRKIDWESQIGRRLKLRDLHVFLTVVQHRSMAKAAQQLGVSPPAVSEVIADLEHAVGVRLVDRSAAGVEPTIYGDALLKRSVAAFDELKHGIRDIEFLSDPTAGEVRIAAPIAFAGGFLTTVIDSFSRRNPRIVCHLTVDTTYRPLEERNVDMVITRIAAPLAEDHLQAEVLYTDRRWVVAATENSWARRRRVGLADLMNEPWTLPPIDSVAGTQAINAFRAAKVDLPLTTVFTNSDIARIALVAKGRFLTISTEAALRFANSDMAIKALPIDLPAMHGAVGVITLKNRTLSPVAQLFIECAREIAKPMPRGESVRYRAGRLKN
jgi:DNA-binding transcriptional LysR family regulator